MRRPTPPSCAPSGLPADRWHVWHNLADPVERIVARHRGGLRVAVGADSEPASGAAAATASHVEIIVRAVRRRHTPPDDVAARRSLSWQWDDDGSLVVRARFTPDAGAAMVAAIEALVPPRTPVRYPVPPSPEDLDEWAQEPPQPEPRQLRSAERTDAYQRHG